jgi:hypothetical protein
MLVVIGTDWIGICKSNYNTIKTAPYWSDILGPKKYICMFPIDPNIFYSKKEKRKKKKKKDRHNPEIRLRFRLQQ